MGIDADLGGVRDAADDVAVLAEQLRVVRSGWDAATRAGESACGLPMARQAFRELQDTWFTEVGAHITVLAGLRQALHESADSYQVTDHSAADTLRMADGGQ